MAWDANRPIPWRRIAREATIFLVIGGVALTLLAKHRQVGTYVGLVVGMVFYVGFVAVLAKFGYQRQSIRQARERRTAVTAKATTTSAQTGRQRPAPTRRTSTGPSQRPNRSTKKRRR